MPRASNGKRNCRVPLRRLEQTDYCSVNSRHHLRASTCSLEYLKRILTKVLDTPLNLAMRRFQCFIWNARYAQEANEGRSSDKSDCPWAVDALFCHVRGDAPQAINRLCDACAFAVIIRCSTILCGCSHKHCSKVKDRESCAQQWTHVSDA
jgi:hypothetical protein